MMTSTDEPRAGSSPPPFPRQNARRLAVDVADALVVVDEYDSDGKRADYLRELLFALLGLVYRASERILHVVQRICERLYLVVGRYREAGLSPRAICAAASLRLWSGVIIERSTRYVPSHIRTSAATKYLRNGAVMFCTIDESAETG